MTASIRDLRVETVPVSALKPYVNNPRTHSDKQINQIAASIETFGFFAGDVGRDYYFDFRFAAIRELRLTFESGRWLVRRVARWVNADVGHMRRWERTALARLFPAMNIVAELVR